MKSIIVDIRRVDNRLLTLVVIFHAKHRSVTTLLTIKVNVNLVTMCAL